MTLILAVACLDGIALFADTGSSQEGIAGVGGKAWVLRDDAQKLFVVPGSFPIGILHMGELTFPTKPNREPISGFIRQYANEAEALRHSSVRAFAEDFGARFEREWNGCAEFPGQCSIFWIAGVEPEGPVVWELICQPANAGSAVYREPLSQVQLPPTYFAQFRYPDAHAVRKMLEGDSSELLAQIDQHMPGQVDAAKLSIGRFQNRHVYARSSTMTRDVAVEFGRDLGELLIELSELVHGKEVSFVGARPAGGRTAFCVIGADGSLVLDSRLSEHASDHAALES